MAVVLWFLWADRVGTLKYPDQVPQVEPIAAPDEAGKALVAGIKVDGILPADRIYYAGFYNSLDAVLLNDSKNDPRTLDTTEKFRRFHTGSLDFAIEKEKVGKYPGLGEGIDRAFTLAAAGVDPRNLTPEDEAKAMTDGLTPRPMTNAMSDRLRAAARAIAWKFNINGE